MTAYMIWVVGVAVTIVLELIREQLKRIADALEAR